MPSSRSGDRLHINNNNENAVQSSVNPNLLRNKASRTAMSSTASSSFGKAAGNVALDQQPRRRPALGDKTNTQNNNVGSVPSEKIGGGNDHTLKHKVPASATITRPAAKPRAQSTVSEASSSKLNAAQSSEATLTASRSYAGGRHLRGVSSSSGTTLARDTQMGEEGANATSSQRSSMISSSSSNTLAPRAAASSQTFASQSQQSQANSRNLLGVHGPSPSVSSADEDMSEAESEWHSSNMGAGTNNSSSKTDTDEEFAVRKDAGSALASSDEEDEALLHGQDGVEDEELEDEYDEEEEEDASESESVQLNNFDPDCLISLPFEIDELARSKVERICAMYEETVLHDAAVRQAEERQAAVSRGEMSADTAAHEDELAIMGLDPEEVRDTSMVAEYSADIFAYMAKCECRTMANPNYMDFQGEIRWHMRATLVDWLMQVHMRYHMMPETLWIAMNVVDRFLSARVVSLAKLQLVGVTAMFIAAKYEEILAPSVDEFVFMTENGYTRDEILKGERIILTTLDFNISGYCSPYSWCRRISKADDYDIQTRTLAKFFMELTLFDHRFLRAKPSLIAAIAMYLSRKMLGGSWNEAFVYYSRTVEEQLIPGANLLLERLLDETFPDCFVCQKYGNRRYLKASIFARDWAVRNQETMLVASTSNASNISALSGQTIATEEHPIISASASASIINSERQLQHHFAEQAVIAPSSTAAVY
ncbi:hypothetical protein L7F22_009305 [Adiantum nelumboides]|nr:hypothetical protein [Adiantum nelumboides]